MENTLGAVAVSIIVLIVVGRFMFAVWSWPALSARIWPRLRMQPWWPVPAERTSELLLRDLLAPTEYDQLCASGYLDIASPSRPGRRYHIPRGPGQVLVVEDGHVTERLCLQPVHTNLPEADVVLMHKLLIESDETTYLQTANHFPRSIWH